MVGDTFLIWDGLGVGGGGGGGQLPKKKKKSCTKKKRQKIYCKAIHAKDTGSKLMATIVLLRKILTLERANGQIKSTGTWWVLISKCKG